MDIMLSEFLWKKFTQCQLNFFCFRKKELVFIEFNIFVSLALSYIVFDETKRSGIDFDWICWRKIWYAQFVLIGRMQSTLWNKSIAVIDDLVYMMILDKWNSIYCHIFFYLHTLENAWKECIKYLQVLIISTQLYRLV